MVPFGQPSDNNWGIDYLPRLFLRHVLLVSKCYARPSRQHMADSCQQEVLYANTARASDHKWSLFSAFSRLRIPTCDSSLEELGGAKEAWPIQKMRPAHRRCTWYNTVLFVAAL